MTKIQSLDNTLLEDIYEFQRQFMEKHKCKDGINFPDGSHTCKAIEKATSRHFKERYKEDMKIKLQLLNSQ